ncbi:hypothetical protein [Benzoatithermus flavus]|uniref:DUF4190 domain-containing protein n=1 Tax=Benzoatithermus flavus TaxID=3108223 RepID=A0ABU8XVV2_9PROT
MATAIRHKPGPLVWTGLALGPIAWAASQQLGYLLAGLACSASGRNAIVAVNVAAALVALLGAGICWRGRRHGGASGGEARAERGFSSLLGLGLGLLFTTVIVAQGLAMLFLQACER